MANETMSSRALQVKRQIEEAFADVRYPGDDLIAYAKDEWECPRINADFRRYHWHDVPRDILRYHWDDLALFSESGHHFYLSAYLLAAFDDRDLRDALLSHFSADAEKIEYQQKYKAFSPRQMNAVRAFLELWRDEATDETTRRFWAVPLAKYFDRDWT